MSFCTGETAGKVPEEGLLGQKETRLDFAILTEMPSKWVVGLRAPPGNGEGPEVAAAARGGGAGLRLPFLLVKCMTTVTATFAAYCPDDTVALFMQLFKWLCRF